MTHNGVSSGLPCHTYGRWFSPGTPASSTTKPGRYDIAESGFKTPKIKSNQIPCHNISGKGASERSDFNDFGHKLHKLFAIILKIK